MFELLEQDEFEQVVFGYDQFSGLKAIIALHDTTLGPGFGGTRMMPYETDQEALEDVLKLSKAMTYKNAAAGINFGGGKAVIIGDARKDKTEELLRAFGRMINSLGGRYITGVDIGTVEDDMVTILKETKCCVALPESYGGVGSTSGATAYGLFHGMKSIVELVYENASLKGRTVAIQGLGNIGFVLAGLLLEEGAVVTATDVNEETVARARRELDLELVSPDQIYDADVDIFSPCALGGVLNDETIPRLKCKIIAGAANNQLKDDQAHSRMIDDRKIVYGVDYILSAGGVIANSHQFIGYIRDRAYKEIRMNISGNIKKVFNIAEKEGMTMVEAAKRLAEHRIQMAANLKKWHF